MSKYQSDTADSGRRTFIKALGLTGGAIAAVAVAGEAVAEVAEAPETEVNGSQGYRETEHVRAYYDSARI